MRPVTLILLFAACAEEPAVDSLAADQAAIPVLPSPDLHVGNFIPGQTLLAQVDDVFPGTTVQLAGGRRLGSGPCISGTCLGIVGPRLLGTAVADANGVANFAIPIPASYPYDGAAFQAMNDIPGAPASQALWRKAQPDAPPPVERNPALPGVFVPHLADDIWINGDTVWLEVSYGGGCADHDFVLAWDGLFLESFPVQTRLELFHNPNGDMCDAWITEQLRFSLVPLRTGWAYGEPDLMVVNAAGLSYDYAF